MSSLQGLPSWKNAARSGKLAHGLHVPQALRMLHVHRINEQLEGTTTLVAGKFKENYVFYVTWFDSGTAESIGGWYCWDPGRGLL